MIKKEWLEVGKQSLYFVLLVAGIALLIGGIDLIQGRSFESEKFIIMLGLWLLTVSMFLGLSPFALDSKQKGMEYLLTLPYSRCRLLFIKLLPRLAAVIFFYLVFVFLYRHMGSDVFGGGFTLFSLAYFALFFISFSLAVIHENFIVQSIWAGIALCGYVVLCLYVFALGFSWKFGMPSSWLGSRLWLDLNYDASSLFTAIAVFLLMAVPFVASFFLTFNRFDLKPARSFNRRQLLFFVPLLLLAFAASLGITYLVQKSSAYDDVNFYLLENQHLLKTSFPGKLDLYSEAGRRRIDTKGAFFWDRLLLEEKGQLFLSGYDTEDGYETIIRLDTKDLSWKELHQVQHSHLASHSYFSFSYDGTGFVYLKRSQVAAGQSGGNNLHAVKSDVLELVSVDPASGRSRTITYRSPLFRRNYEPRFIGCDKINGLRFWLIAHRWKNVLRLWEDGRVEDLGLSKGFPAYVSGLLFTRSDNSLLVRRLLDVDSETIKEIAGDFNLVNTFRSFLLNKQMGEIYAMRDKRIVRIDLTTLAVEDVGPDRGHIRIVPPGDFYYVEFENWPPLPIDKWKKLYRLQGGKMIFLKQFDFDDAEYGHIIVNSNGVIVHQWQVKSGSVTKESRKIFTFPDLRELKFKKLN